MSDIKEKKFDINPHVIRQLGEELVPDEMTALVELVKNAYDADADYVKIDINTKGNTQTNHYLILTIKGILSWRTLALG